MIIEKDGVTTFQALPQLLKKWEEEGRLTPLDRHFALELSHIHQETSPLFVLICALLSQHLSQQHTCLPLSQIAFDNPLQEKVSHCQITASLEEVIETLSRFSAITTPHTQTDEKETQIANHSQRLSAPLVLDNGYLYLQRYYQFETRVSDTLLRLARDVTHSLSIQEYKHIATTLDLLYPNAPQSQKTAMHDGQCSNEQKSNEQKSNENKFDWQKIATATALTKTLAVITGGPGTGKTTTVTKLLFLLCLQQIRASSNTSKNLTIKLVAPTGKAAARLSESIKASKSRLRDEITQWTTDKAHTERHLIALNQIPEEAATLHRLLGVIPNSHKFRFDEHNPLRLNILIVDEASMVDLPMMYKLLHALPQHARLILLGDQDQLASVEAGAVLADICAGLATSNAYHHQWQMRYSQDHAQVLSQVCNTDLTAFIDKRGQTQTTHIGDSLCMLMHSHRFKGDAGIGQLASAVNQANKQKITQVWQKGYSELCWLEHQVHAKGNFGLNALLEQSVSAYGHYLTMVRNQLQSCETIIHCFNQYRILCAMRSGEYGVDGINQSVTQALWQAKLIQPVQEFYPGRPIIIQSNDYNLGLFNGDIGLILPDKNRHNKLMAHFIQADGSLLSVLPARLPQHDTCYAMTVHKSQGSEFKQVALVLPVSPSPAQKQLLTKELIYTGITRAKAHFTCLGSEKVFETACLKATQRASGLAFRLWKEQAPQ
ncbi:exodeoxyribonuclease V subunit alpha [uncultured Shewanella sp.]|uniref:exodeoxyribonuclease V subunit alpha n=1 Tax=uncultured Shewanella sp. TaxID=173975 RepID=UPI00262DFF0D|nr:exodeoxyribonuclease V subunit alpha [uncultured Shewanella sp.]